LGGINTAAAKKSTAFATMTHNINVSPAALRMRTYDEHRALACTHVHTDTQKGQAPRPVAKVARGQCDWKGTSPIDRVFRAQSNGFQHVYSCVMAQHYLVVWPCNLSDQTCMERHVCVHEKVTTTNFEGTRTALGKRTQHCMCAYASRVNVLKAKP